MPTVELKEHHWYARMTCKKKKCQINLNIIFYQHVSAVMVCQCGYDNLERDMAQQSSQFNVSNPVGLWDMK